MLAEFPLLVCAILNKVFTTIALNGSLTLLYWGNVHHLSVELVVCVSDSTEMNLGN